MYPINTRENTTLFNRYLKKACKSKNIIPVGRLGLYRYLDMDQAISLVFDMMPLIEKWILLNSKKKYERISELIKSY